MPYNAIMLANGSVNINNIIDPNPKPSIAWLSELLIAAMNIKPIITIMAIAYHPNMDPV